MGMGFSLVVLEG